MDIKLNKEVKDVTIINGFPGFGLVATIATEFLIDHLDVELIGRYWFEDMPSTLAIHEGKLINPIGIFYNEKHNLVIIHSITAAQGIEWKAAEFIQKIAEKTQANRIIALEGVGISGAEASEEPRLFYYTTDQEIENKMNEIGVKPLTEGIILGVTSSLLLKSDIPTACLFTETESNLPDNKAGAKVIEILDKFLGMEVKYEPLLEQAANFEKKLKDLVDKSQAALSHPDKKTLSYVG